MENKQSLFVLLHVPKYRYLQFEADLQKLAVHDSNSKQKHCRINLGQHHNNPQRILHINKSNI